jgi:hypothetical protein
MERESARASESVDLSIFLSRERKTRYLALHAPSGREHVVEARNALKLLLALLQLATGADEGRFAGRLVKRVPHCPARWTCLRRVVLQADDRVGRASGSPR